MTRRTQRALPLATFVGALLLTGMLWVGATTATGERRLTVCTVQQQGPGHRITISAAAPGARKASLLRLCEGAGFAVRPGKGIRQTCLDVDRMNTPWPKSITIGSAWGRITLRRTLWRFHPWDGDLWSAHAQYRNAKHDVLVDLNARHREPGAERCA